MPVKGKVESDAEAIELVQAPARDPVAPTRCSSYWSAITVSCAMPLPAVRRLAGPLASPGWTRGWSATLRTRVVEAMAGDGRGTLLVSEGCGHRMAGQRRC